MARRYALIDQDIGGDDYRMIALRMTCLGQSMGHSTVRGVILNTLERLATVIMARVDALGDPAAVARDPRFQSALACIIQDVYAQKRAQEHS